MSKKEPVPIELRHEAIHDVLSAMPSWTLRWGSLALSLVVFLLIGLSFLIPYPDTVRGTITISSQKISVDLPSKKSGRLVYWAVREGQTVREGTDLAMIEGEISYADFIRTEKALHDFYACWVQQPDCHLATETLPLANLPSAFPQYTFSQLKKVYEEYVFLKKNNFAEKEKQNLEGQAAALERLKEQTLKEKMILEKNASIAQKQLSRDKSLKESKIYSEVDAENSEKIYLQERYKVENLQSQYLNYEWRLSQIQKTQQELEKQEAWRTQNLWAEVKTATERLQTDLQAWRKTHILRAEIDGKVSLGKFWAENQYIQAGETLLTINPLEKEIIGQAWVGAEGFGKIAIGQRVLVCLYAFDCQEYGKIEGRVQSISQSLVEGRYRLEIALPTPLRTINHFAVPAENQVWQGDAYIQTDNSMLIEKIFYQLRYLLQR